MDLNFIWFILLMFLIIGYAILDGFDLGVGILHFFSKSDDERRININAIAPVWDGNEVWLITAGGALFAAFPIVYATVFSGFYIAFMLLLTALIFRAVSMEFRGKVDSPRWRKIWDFGFASGSLLSALLFGVTAGNILRGIPINSELMFEGNFIGLLNPYSLLTGLIAVVLFSLHGGIFLMQKTEGVHKENIAGKLNGLWIIFVILFFVLLLYTIFEARYLFDNVLRNPLFYFFSALLLLSVIYIPVGIKSGKFKAAFIASSLIILSMISSMSVSLFPSFIPSSISKEFNLTIYNASSSQTTLQTMLIIALIGMPLVILYTIFIYKVFKGKVIITKDSY
ncbi:MAG: cytochrome d ubiquinol oxidase subunit II [Ignavibacteria bacterium]|nr:cytochrome d ubiquinol oxidase subunit II [Ignavibacteria bacterium]